MSEKPLNLIMITSDEMRGDAPSFMGNPDCKTPNIDRFAEKGIQFRNHFTVHGKCVPSRCAVITGRYCHTDGFRTVNGTNHLPAGTPNVLSAVKAAGYETAAFGHTHMWEDKWGNNKKSSGCVDYHSYTEEYFDHILETKHEVQQPDENSAKIRYSDETMSLEVGPQLGPLTGFCDDNRALQAEHFINNVRDESKPFYMQVDFGQPHPGYNVEEPFFSMYDRDKITPFEYAVGEKAPLHLKKMREIRGTTGTEEDFRQLQAVYYGMCSKVDTNIGYVLDAVEKAGLMDNTVVVFYTDHGDFAGQYGLPEKWDTAMNDCIMHVPLILHAPGLEGGRTVESLTEHTDIAPTVLELLGIEPDWLIHGESLLPTIDGGRKKEAVFGDGGHEKEMRDRFGQPHTKKDKKGRDFPTTLGKQATYGLYPDSMARTKMVRTDEWKLVIREVGGNELYNMKEDPNEMNNLFGEEQYMKIEHELMLKMIEWCLWTDTDLPYQPNVGA